jgi:hypothetical protein
MDEGRDDEREGREDVMKKRCKDGKGEGDARGDEKGINYEGIFTEGEGQWKIEVRNERLILGKG